jgi:hypothetical protein
VPKRSEGLFFIRAVWRGNVYTADCPGKRVHAEVLALGTALDYERNPAGS